MLLPLLEQVVSKKEEPEDEQETNDLVGPELTSSRNAQGMLIPLGRSSGEDLGGRGVGTILLGWLEVTPLPCGCCLERADLYQKGVRGLARGTKSYGAMEKPLTSSDAVMA